MTSSIWFLRMSLKFGFKVNKERVVNQKASYSTVMILLSYFMFYIDGTRR